MRHRGYLGRGTAGAAAAHGVRRARSRARRERQSLGDALYVIYVTCLVAFFPLSALLQSAVPGPGPTRSAAAAAAPVLVVVGALLVLVARPAAAVRGGPVVLPPEDARLLLTWPVPRRALVLPALGAALSRAVAGALLVSVALLYVDIRDLGAPAAAALRDDVLLPTLLSVDALLLAWLVQSSRRAAAVSRAMGLAAGAAALVAVCWVARQIAVDGFVGALGDIARAGPSPATLPFSGATTGAASSHGLAVALVLAVLLVPLGLLSLRAADRVTPEQLLSRSRRADATRTGLRLGFTASVYLTRTEPLRRARRRRLALPRRLPVLRPQAAALVGKGFLQEQGTPLLPRLLSCAAVSGVVLAAAAHVTPGRSLAATTVWSLVAAGALTVVATRFADPVRLDVDRAPFAGAVPVPHLMIARVDVLVSTAVAFAGTLLGGVGAVLLGIVEADQLIDVTLAALALALLLAAAGALGALSDDPSPFLPPQVALGYRTTGLISVLVGCLASGLILRHESAPAAASAATTAAATDRLPLAALALAVTAVIAMLLATFRAAGALTRGR